jgi:hypothetical protein
VQTYGFSKISLQLKLSISKVLAEGKSMIYFSEKEFFLTFATPLWNVMAITFIADYNSQK